MPDYINPGAFAIDSLQKLMMQRELEKRQQMLDALAQQKVEQEFELRKQEQDRLAAEERRLAEADKRNFDQSKYNQEDTQVARRFDDDLPGDYISPEEAKLREKHGFGGSFRTKMLPKANLVVDVNGNAPGVSPDEQARQAALPSVIAAYSARGGARYLQAQAVAQARAEQARAAEDARKERADADRASREALAREGNLTRATIAAGNVASRTDIAANAAQAKADKEAEKKAEKDKQDSINRNAAVASIDETLGALNELIDPNTGQLKPGVSGTAGFDSFRSYIPGTAAANASVNLDRLKSQLIVNLMAEMKRQSKTGSTGFGALSERELDVLDKAANGLSSHQSDEALRQGLIRLGGKLMDMRRRATGGASVPASPAQPTNGTETPAQRLERLKKMAGQ